MVKTVAFSSLIRKIRARTVRYMIKESLLRRLVVRKIKKTTNESHGAKLS